MRGLLPALVALTGALVALPVLAEPADALNWLQRIAIAAQKLNYTGTFTYEAGTTSETSRITHLVDPTGEHERIEVLDGSRRELVRSNSEVQCYLPEDRIVIVERRRQEKAFPGLLPSSVGGLTEHYVIRKGEMARVAGLESQTVILEPKDHLRYGRLLWADRETGLLLKARTVNERNEVIEQFAFTQLQIGGAIDREALQPRARADSGQWRVLHARTSPLSAAAGDWVFKTALPGFRRNAGMIRQGASKGTETAHVVFSDGLSSISVFIEPLVDGVAAGRDSEAFSVGAINGYKRTLGKHRITVLGEVPESALRLLGDGIEGRKR